MRKRTPSRGAPGAVAGPDLPRIPEPVSLVVADEQGAEVCSAAGGLGVAADHELLPEHALELQPVFGATVRIGRNGTLGDQPLPAGAAGLREATLRPVAPGLTDPQPLRRPDRLLEPGAALDQRPRGEILFACFEEVEDAVDDRGRFDQCRRRVRDAESVLQPAEGRLLAVEHDDLAVQQEPVRRWAASAACSSG